MGIDISVKINQNIIGFLAIAAVFIAAEGSGAFIGKAWVEWIILICLGVYREV